MTYVQVAAAVVKSGREPCRRSTGLLIAIPAHAQQARLRTRIPADFAELDELLEVITR